MPTVQLFRSPLKQQCERFLNMHRPRRGRDWLVALAHSPLAELPLDLYGEGEIVAHLEKQVAELLGKEAAVFVPKGVIAQQVALRVWTDRSGWPTVALHPKSHIDLDEESAYQRLHGLVPVRLGADHLPFGAAELLALREKLGAIVVELPLRRAGFKLPAWDELVTVAAWARLHQVPLHFDGARLWESGPFYGRSYAEIASLADSVYVSFYKGLGGMAGCVLAGSADFLSECRPWLTRHGANLYTAFPYLIAALEGLTYHLPKLPGYCARAREIAAALATIPGVAVTPEPPQTNGFQLFLPGAIAALEEAVLAVARQEKLWLFNALIPTAIPQLTVTEVQIGEAAEDLKTAEIVAAVRTVVDQAAQKRP